MKSMYLNQMSKKFKSLKDIPAWLSEIVDISDQVKLIRSAFGLTQNVLAKRMGLENNAPIADLENKKIKNPTIETLKRYAKALNCELLIRLVPKTEISKIVYEQAEKRAREIVNLSVSNAAMELQKPLKKTIGEEIKRIRNQLIEKRRQALWKS